ncbi:glycine receptor subunit alpha-4-like [Montipora capricornis]|uniref:glycine receptor subunit alpha-4-like n=1 Tax=Montipora capricornis TaxID=246305 RepID=UPI0035F1EADA
MFCQLKLANGMLISLVLHFLCRKAETNTVTVTTRPDYCFQGDTSHPYDQTMKNSSWKTTSLAELLHNMFKCYDSRMRVENSQVSEPTEVIVNLYILSIGNFKVRDMDFQLSFYFRQKWQDSRLSYGDHFPEDDITLGGGILQQLWLPETYFVNKKGSRNSEDAHFFVRIFRNGTLLVITKNTLTMDCYMDLRHFPFDDQKCNLTLESFGFTTKDVVYKWLSQKSHEAVEKGDGLSISEFDLGSIRIFEVTTVYKTGPFSGLKMELNFHRKSTYYLIQIYIPSGMIVVLSWVSFWIDYNSIPARTALGITTVLAMTTLLFGVQSSLPSVPYIKAVDLFMIVSFANVFAALVEYAIVNYTSMREKQKKKSRWSENKQTVNKDILMQSYRNASFENNNQSDYRFEDDAVHGGNVDVNTSLNKFDHEPVANGKASTKHWSRDQARVSRLQRCSWPCKITADAIDAWSRVMFPLAYGLFIVAYWILYSSNLTED